MLSITLFLGVIILFYVWIKWKYSFWNRNKVRGPRSSLIVGNIGSTFTFSRHWGDVTNDWYNEYSDEPYIGYYKMLQPAILVRDPDIVGKILITDFNKFAHNDFKLSKRQDPLTAANPFFAKDDEWRESRKRFSPAFSHIKLKALLPIMNTIGEHFSEFIKSFPPNTDFNAKDLGVRFTSENMIRCIFSIDPGCFNREHDSEFLEAAKRVFEPSFLVGVKFLAMPVLPLWALDLLPAPFIPYSVDQLFRRLAAQNKTSRSGKTQCNDFFQIFLQLQNKHNFNDTVLAGTAITLFVEGIETSSLTLAYTLYELAINPQCQDKIREEISTTRSKYDGQITYEGLQEMCYVESVLLESLRKHPTLLVLQKVCTQQYTLPKTSGQSKPVTIQPGTVVHIPVLSIHSDPKYYPNPEEFQPERFTEDNNNRRSMMFLGFGDGPRLCPGMRIAVLQIKVILSHIVENFNIKISPNHKPIVFDPQTAFAHPKDGILIQLDAR